MRRCIRLIPLALIAVLFAFHTPQSSIAQETLEDAEGLNDQVVELHQQGKYAEAIPLAQRTLEIRERLLGANHEDVASSLNNLAALYDAMSQYDKAEPLYVRAMQIRKKALGEDHPDYAVSLNNLAVLYVAMAQYAKAEPLYVRASEIWKKALGAEHPDYAASLSNLAWLCYSMGQPEKAEPLYLRAMEIRRKALGEDHPHYASSLNYLAMLYHAMGQHDKAEPLFVRAMEITKKALGEDHPDYAKSLNNLAMLYAFTGQYAKGRPLFLRATEISRKVLGENHPSYATSLDNLAALYHAMGQYDKAEPLYVQAMEVRKKSLGEDHPDYAKSLNNLAGLYESMGQYAKAEPLCVRSSEICKKALGEDHPDYTSSLNNLAMLYAATDRNRQALELRRRASHIEEEQTDHILGFTSEKGKLAYLFSLSGFADTHLTLVRNAFPRDPEAVDWAMGLALHRKGLVLESLLWQRQVVGENREASGKFDEWKGVMQQLGALTLRGPGKEGPERYKENLRQLSEQREKLEGELSRLSADFALQQKQRKVDTQTLSKLLPSDSALIEIVKVNLFNFKATGKEKKWLPARYLAFVLKAGGKPVMVDLGDAEKIEEALTDWKEVLTQSARGIGAQGEAHAEKQLTARGKLLYRLTFAPLEPYLAGCRTLFVAPDGLLNLLPFQTLQQPDGAYLIEKYCFNYLSSGRDLVKFGHKGGKATEPVVIANPDFDLSSADRIAEANKLPVKPTLLAEAPLRSANLKDMSFPPLPATATEANAVVGLLKNSKPTLYEGSRALKESVKGLHSPRVLHFATHGFSLSDQKLTDLMEDRPGLDVDTDRSWQRMAAAGIENPLMRSGLALAGANRFGKEDSGKAEDGILTAQEISALDLTGTDLVVLSACDTGLGQVRNGEGVFGLRRAFLHAGAKTLIMSLAKVPDKETKELMVEFYTRWLKSGDKVKALHDAQLTILHQHRKAHGAAHPLFWGMFVAMGDPK